MLDFPKLDWNAVAAGVQMLPDEAIRMGLETAANVDSLLGAWESAWAQGLTAMGLPADDLAIKNKVLREVLLGFYRAEAMRRCLKSG